MFNRVFGFFLYRRFLFQQLYSFSLKRLLSQQSVNRLVADLIHLNKHLFYLAVYLILEPNVSVYEPTMTFNGIKNGFKNSNIFFLIKWRVLNTWIIFNERITRSNTVVIKYVTRIFLGGNVQVYNLSLPIIIYIYIYITKAYNLCKTIYLFYITLNV